MKGQCLFCWLCFDIWKEDVWGKQNQKGHFCTHCSTATLERKIFEAGKLAKAHTWVSLFLCNFTAKWNICAHCCIPALQRKTFVKSSYQVMKLCAWLPFQHSKEDFCQFLNGFQLISQRLYNNWFIKQLLRNCWCIFYIFNS